MARPAPPRSKSWVVPGSRANEPPKATNLVQVTPAIRAAWQAMGFKGPMPSIYSTPLGPNIAGEAPWPRVPSTSRVLITPQVAAGLQTLGLTRNRDLNALKVLMHEFAHTRQPMTLNRPTFEGGAEAYAQSRLLDALRRIGVSTHDQSNRWPGYSYPGFANKMFQSGWQPLNRGQFGRP